ncbi:HU family DNA-binding protein [Microvirga yunnanensis]|uniref:HU family DNA-binding protein n=1 Tax=Microvirga yunnanensis TaxID=2953740 RepID=UPI0021C6111C|nr:HU family DNA-binding protein [Microvirga sp. HBU65207]
MPERASGTRLALAVAQAANLPQAEALPLVGAVLSETSDCLVAGEPVKISGFGGFVPRKSGKRKGRDPKTGCKVAIEPRTVVSFKPSDVMVSHVNDELRRLAAE